MKQGKLIVVEGACDGIGKTTQFLLLKEHLEKDGLKVVNHHFPSYGTYHGAPVEHYLAGELGHPSETSPYLINSLYAIDRAITWQNKLKKSFNRGEIVLLDRYTTSSIIYQSANFDTLDEKANFIDYICEYEFQKLGIKVPDNVIFLVAPFDLAMEQKNARKSNEGIENDIHERDLVFMKRVYDTARFAAEYLNWDWIICNDGDKMRSIEDIHQEIYTRIRKK